MIEKKDIQILNKTGWNFDNSYANLPETFYTKIDPTPVSSPELVKLNESLAESLGLNVKELVVKKSIDVFGGNKIPEGATPLAQAYAGHQYGYFTMLGDGRAILLGEHITPNKNRFDIQLKGSGRTPYSRGGDGRATLGPMLREYIISEAMHAFGIPTTRSLAVIATGDKIRRETILPGAVLTRVAASHIRVGTFQYVAKWGSLKELKDLADYTIKRHYKTVSKESNPYLSLLKEVIKRQADLIARWQLVGFVHGVMNTDNMTICGETIDYGPCAFIDSYDPETVFSSIDTHGRYAYGNQPDIGAWNLARFAETLLPLLNDNQEEAISQAEEAIAEFNYMYYERYINGMCSKLGMLNPKTEDESLVKDLLQIMKKNQADYTNTFRELSLGKSKDIIMNGTDEFTQWYDRWQSRLVNQNETKDSIYKRMKSFNPSIIPRNHSVEDALNAAVDHQDYSVLEKLLSALSDPYGYTEEQEIYTNIPEKTDKCYRTFCGT